MRNFEKHRIFPYIAWAIFIACAAFIFYLIFELQGMAVYLDGKMDEKVELIESV